MKYNLWTLLKFVAIYFLWQVQITPLMEVPLGVGIASDPMSTRRGGKRLPMEDFCYYNWPISGIEQVLKCKYSRLSFFDEHAI